MSKTLHVKGIPLFNLMTFEKISLLIGVCFFLGVNLSYANVQNQQDDPVDGGTLSEDPFHFCVGDGEPDHVELVSVEGAEGPNSAWVVTDEDGKILGLPPTPEAVNFDGAGPGVCLIWHLSYADGLQGLEMGNNALTDLVGTYDLSDDNVRVYRNQPEGGELSGGPYEFVVGDGTPDMVMDVTVSGNSGANSAWVVTDEAGKILGLPPTPEAVNFDGAGPGVCLIWHLSYADGLQGLEMGNNALTDLMGCYDLSNQVRVVRVVPTQISNDDITLYPVPARNVLRVSANKMNSAEALYSLYDMAGNDVTNKVRLLDEDNMSFDIQSLPNGLYLLKIRDNSGMVYTKKVVKQ